MPEPEPTGYTISAAVEAFLLDRQVRGLAPNTLRYYRDELHQLELYTGACDMGGISAEVLRGFYASLESKRNRGGIHSVYRSVHAFLAWFALETDGEYTPPKVVVKPPRIKPLPGVAVADIQAMIAACHGRNAVRNQTMLRFLLDTGARAFEFIALDLRDLDLTTGAVRIQRGKGDHERTVYIGANTRRAMRRYLRARVHLNPAAPLWPLDDGRRMTKRALRHVVETAAKAAGVPVPGLHDFRRAFALNMHRAGVDLLTISRLMGHRDLETTKRYIREDDADLRAGHAKGSPVDNAGL